MISFNFNLRNPWSQEFKMLWNKVYDTPHPSKYLELEIYKDSTLLTVMFNWTVRQSHAGVNIDVGLFGYCFHFNFYDIRHWNHEEGRYYKYSEELGEH